MRTFIRRLQRKRRSRDFRAEDGSLTIEFVVILPILVTALAFAFEFGQIFIAHQSTEHNVRSAVRYLMRSDLGEPTRVAAEKAIAENIVRTGQPVGGVTPEYLQAGQATVVIDEAYSSFSSTTFSRSGTTFQISVQVNYPLTLFGVFGLEGLTTIPFVIVEDARYVGI